MAWERWNSMMTPEPEPEPLKEEEGVEEGEEEPEVEGALLLLPASGLRRTGPVGSPEATVTAEAAARRACFFSFRWWRRERGRGRERGREREIEGGREGGKERKRNMRRKEVGERAIVGLRSKNGSAKLELRAIQKNCSRTRNRAAMPLNLHRGLPKDKSGHSGRKIKAQKRSSTHLSAGH